MKTPIDIHSCSYYCHRPECIKAQRDELRAKYVALHDQHEQFKTRLAEAIEQMPFGDTAASFAQFVRNFK